MLQLKLLAVLVVFCAIHDTHSYALAGIGSGIGGGNIGGGFRSGGKHKF